MSEKRVIEIGNHPVDVWYNELHDDGFKYFAELDGDLGSSIKNRFFITYFCGISCSEIPDSIHLVISHTRSEFKKVNFITLKKKRSVCELGIILEFCYQDWEIAESVGSFVYRFIDSIINELKIDAKPEKTEYGYFVECISRRHDVPDIYSWYSEIEHSIEKIYQRVLVDPTKLKLTHQKYGEDRIHWWIRYVFVPLIGSGTIAAIIVKYLLE